jgi:hypothetical protein
MARNTNRLTARQVTSLLQKLDRGELQPEDRRLWPDGNNGYLNLKGWTLRMDVHQSLAR